MGACKSVSAKLGTMQKPNDVLTGSAVMAAVES